MSHIDVLLCYRGRYRDQVTRLDSLLEAHGLSVTYDWELLTPDAPYTDAEVEWLDLGSPGTTGPVKWRGPLSEAVKRSERRYRDESSGRLDVEGVKTLAAPGSRFRAAAGRVRAS